MKAIVKSVARRFASAFVWFLWKSASGRYLYGQIINRAMARTQAVMHRGASIIFSTPNAQSQFRADSFATKEPETLDWIDGIPTGSILWDIGANVGLYSCYAAKARGCRVFSFEPSVFNLELLARNIFLNKLTDQVTIIPLPLALEIAASTLNMTTTEWGGAMSTFGQEYGHDGEPIIKTFDFPTIGLSMADAVNLLKVPQPDYIKMDVDGIEHLILKGGMSILQRVKSVSIEINDKFSTQADDASLYLKQAGLTLKAKRHADQFDSPSSQARFTFNQVWVR